MGFVLVSVVCSVIVSILLKWVRLRHLDTRQMIFWNYPVAVLLTYLFFPPQWSGLFSVDSPWILYGTMAILLPGLFLILSASLRYRGLVVTEVAQRISLVIPLLAAFVLFQEKMHMSSLLGVGLGFLSILFCIGWHRNPVTPADFNNIAVRHKNRNATLFPMLVFLGYGLVDILFKQVAQLTVVPYTTSMLLIFAGAFLVAFLYLAFILIGKRAVFSRQSMYWGLLLGLFNFLNILFYMKAHRALPDQPSLVFTGMNIGVIALGVLAGRLLFQEKPSRLNYFGVALAMLAVFVIAFTLKSR